MGARDLLKRLLGESAVYGMAGAIQKSIGLFLIPIYTRCFTPEEYGVLALLSAFSVLFDIFIVLGLDNSAARWFYDTEEVEDRRITIASWFWCQLAVGLLTAAGLLLAAPLIAPLLLGEGGDVRLMSLVILLVPLGTFLKVTGNTLRYQRAAWKAATFSVVSALSTVGLVILMVVGLDLGMIGVYAGQIAALCLVAVVGALLLRPWIAPRHASRERLRQMLSFGLPLVPAGIASWVRLSSDRLILQSSWSEAEVGLFALAFQLAAVVGLCTSAFDMAYGPFAYSIHQQPHARDLYARVLTLFAFGGAWLCVVVSLFDDLIIALLATEAYASAASGVPMLCFSHLFYGMVGIASIGPGIVKKSGPVATSIFIAAAVSLGMNFALIPSLGRDAAALSNMCSSLAAAAWLFWQGQRLYPIPYRFGGVAACVLTAWAIVAVDTFFINDHGHFATAIRALMALGYLTLALPLGISRLAREA